MILRKLQRTIKLEADVYGKIEQMAKEDNRSFNNMIEKLVIEALNARQQISEG